LALENECRGSAKKALGGFIFGVMKTNEAKIKNSVNEKSAL
jgi:hypothetical protein